MQDVGRNEPCPCGSGKKYKKCCSKKQVVSIQTLLVTEQMDLQLQFLSEAMGPKQALFKEDISYVLNHVTETFNEPQFLTVYLSFIFGLRKEDSTTYWENFLEEKSTVTERPRLRELMKQWASPKPVLAEVVSMDEDIREIIMKDLLDDQEYTVVLPEFHSWSSIDFIYALLIPFEEKWVPYGFMLPAVYSQNEREQVIDRISQLNIDNIEGENRVNWLTTEMSTRIINAMVERTESLESEGEWLGQMVQEIDKDAQTEAVHELKNYWDKQGDEDLSLFACHIASSYFAEHGEKIRKPQPYIAAVSYLMAQHATNHPITQKEAGEAFDISAASVSSAARKMEKWFLEELRILQDQSN
ncbi:hypothetical protein E2R51_07770 [Jeotgalibacillus sp. S-D1]|uniref:YecA family protein n=1 Tax=Jeotgalibacillus sp. S-D1 TaxID=2552189 RepID=UPI0010593095|nr:SEC-C metal-binding domain-containing protein [Jeotgalibacillus sp. S-D1]TDL32574.1 hypothetical protein E2R51_07770 [Jeotgalibacillus sp. S-D1]